MEKTPENIELQNEIRKKHGAIIGEIVKIAETTLSSPEEILRDVREGKKGLTSRARQIAALLEKIDPVERDSALKEADELHMLNSRTPGTGL